jgi:hypothetical protein
MADTWTCRIHNIELPRTSDGFCPGCMADMNGAPDPGQMTPDQRVTELDRWIAQLSVPFTMAGLREEAKGPHAKMDDSRTDPRGEAHYRWNVDTSDG